MRVLVTGGSGHLGRDVVGRLTASGSEVRVLSRRPLHDAGVEWAEGDLATGRGVPNAVAGVEAIVHAATLSPAATRGFRPIDLVRTPTAVDVEGTRRLLVHAERAGVEHFLHVSIVGLRHIRRLPYARVKLAAEEEVRGAGVPWSIVRATGFYWLLERTLADLAPLPVWLLPGAVNLQPVDSAEFADYVVECLRAGPQGEQPDFAGPETASLPAIARQYQAARSIERRIASVPLPARLARAITAGNTSSDGRRGTTTWSAWLAQGQAGGGNNR